MFFRQVISLTMANLKVRYRKTVAGFLWVILNPLLLFAVQCFAFRSVLKINIPNYPLFLLSGLLPWIFLTQSLEMCTGVLVNSGTMLKSFPVRPLVFVMAQIFDNGLNFLAALVILGLPTLTTSRSWHLSLLLIPIPIGLLFCATLALSFLMSMVQVFLRDTRFLVSFAMQILIYVTPIFYPLQFVPDEYQWIIRGNPAYHLIALFRSVILDFNWDDFIKESLSASAVCVIFSLAAWTFWSRFRNALYLNI